MSEKTPALLPTRANLEHLKNEAKRRLKEMRVDDPGATLMAAQLVIARRYGYASWRRLKACVDALQSEGARLVLAVSEGDVQSAGVILDRHPELVNAAADLDPHVLRPSDSLAMRLIHLAVAENRIEMVRLLIARGVNLNVRNTDGRLPLHDCFELSRDEIAKVLFAAGAEADVCAAAAYGMNERLLEILKGDARLANDFQTGILPFGWSTYGNQPLSAQILLDHGAILNAEAWGPASHVASVKFARILLANGASPNCKDEKSGDTPMHGAIKSRIVADPTAFVELLLQAGADPGVRNKEGRTPLEEALLQSGKIAETYFPARPLTAKKLDRVIELLRSSNNV